MLEKRDWQWTGLPAGRTRSSESRNWKAVGGQPSQTLNDGLPNQARVPIRNEGSLHVVVGDSDSLKPECVQGTYVSVDHCRTMDDGPEDPADAAIVEAGCPIPFTHHLSST